VLCRLHVNTNEKWLNATSNYASDRFVTKRNTIPGCRAAAKSWKGKHLEDFVGVERGREIREQKSKSLKERWENPDFRERAKKKPQDTSAYIEAAKKKHANSDFKIKHSEAIKRSWIKRKS
jgi:hypothetical protein